MRSKWIALALALCLAAPLAGCRDEGAAERMGRELDEATEDAAGAFEELGEEIGEAADETREAAKKAAAEFRDEVED